jgi:hypothetical protein
MLFQPRNEGDFNFSLSTAAKKFAQHIVDTSKAKLEKDDKAPTHDKLKDKKRKALEFDLEAGTEALKLDYSRHMFEIDASSSIIQIGALLLGDIRLLRLTGVLGDTADLWSHLAVESGDREAIKKFITRLMYGSSITLRAFCKDNGFDHTPALRKDIRIATREDGILGNIMALRDLILNTGKASLEGDTNVIIDGDTLLYKCRKGKTKRPVVKPIHIYDNGNTYIHRYNYYEIIPDMQRSAIGLVSFLFHSIDVRILVPVLSAIDGRGFPIHDAVVLTLNDVSRAQYAWGHSVNRIYKNREDILTHYLSSIVPDTNHDIFRSTIKRLLKTVDKNNPDLCSQDIPSLLSGDNKLGLKFTGAGFSY